MKLPCYFSPLSKEVQLGFPHIPTTGSIEKLGWGNYENWYSSHCSDCSDNIGCDDFAVRIANENNVPVFRALCSFVPFVVKNDHEGPTEDSPILWDESLIAGSAILVNSPTY
jgi:hypothetical protein